MKILKNILIYVSFGLAILVSLLFSFVELRSLIAGDFIISAYPVISFFRYLFRALFFLSILTFSVVGIVLRIKKLKPSILEMIVITVVAMSSFFSLVFYEWYIALIIVVISHLLYGTHLFMMFEK